MNMNGFSFLVKEHELVQDMNELFFLVSFLLYGRTEDKVWEERLPVSGVGM